MRTIKGLPINQDEDNQKFPDGQILNESITKTGTPVVREIYGDVLTNIYKILRSAGITANQEEDSEINGYQLHDALKIFTNNLNDIKQILTVSTGVNEITTALDISYLPEDYVFVAQLTEAVSKSNSYIISNNSISYPVSFSSDIEASSLVVVTLNSSETRITALGSGSTESVASSNLDVSVSFPLSFNNSSKLLFLENGILIEKGPKSYLVQNKIQVLEGTNDVHILEAVVLKNRLICLCNNISQVDYKIYSFLLSDLENVEGIVSCPVNNSLDSHPFMYSDGEFVYFTNSDELLNSSSDDFKLGKFSFNESNLSLTSSSSFELESSFKKTTNCYIKNNSIYSLISGVVESFDFSSTTRIYNGFYSFNNGYIFVFENQLYFSTGDIASKWII